MRFSYILLTVVVLSLCFVPLSGQYQNDIRSFRHLEIRGHTGNHLYTGEELKEVLSNGYGSVEVRYGWQSANPEGWQSMYLYPAYGLGWYSGFVGNPEQLGKPGAVYGFISFPLFNHHRHQIMIEPALGLSYDLKPYDAETNAHNDAIGSRFNVYFNFNIGAKYRLNREIDLTYGLDFTHFSNGRSFRPNSGLNMWGPNVGFRYHFNTKQNKVDNSAFPEVILDSRPMLTHFNPATPIRKGEMLVYAAGGIVQNDEDKGTNKQHGTFTSFVEYNYRLNMKSGFAAGVNWFYDGSLTASYDAYSHHFYGVHAGYDFMFWNFSFRVQVGTYLHDEAFDMKGNFFFRPALKYDINKRFFAQLGLKTQAGFKADWVEYGLGVRLFN